MHKSRVLNQVGMKYIVFFLFPILLCLFYCNLRGISFFSLYLPNSINNDTLFYYKQVEGVLAYGIPQGFFGYNESRAILGSFATWNPILFLPWIIWGGIFGWNYMSMTICNIVLMSFGLVLFVKLAEIDWKDMGVGFLLLSLYPSLPLHLICGLVETTILFLLLIYWGMAISWSLGNNEKRNLIGMFVSGSLLTVCRPFMIILILLPCFILLKNKNYVCKIISILLLMGNIISYWVYSHFFASAYYMEMFDSEMFKALFRGDIEGFFSRFSPIMKEFFVCIGDAFVNSNTAGMQYVLAIVSAIVLAICVIFSKHDKERLVDATYVVMVVGLIGATLLIGGKINEGGRHIWSFSVCGMLLCARKIEDKKAVWGNMFIGLILFGLLMRGSLVPNDYDIPSYNEKLAGELNYWEYVYQKENVTLTEGLSYENTLIWVMFDWNGQEAVQTDHKQLYNVPKGYGISCCTQGYVIENWNDLKSKYIMTLSGGYIESLCIQMGYEELGRTENMVLYRRY